MKNVCIVMVLVLAVLICCGCHASTGTVPNNEAGSTAAPTDAPTQPNYDTPVLTAEAEDMIRTAFLAASEEDCTKDALRVEYYGEYEGAALPRLIALYGSL